MSGNKKSPVRRIICILLIVLSVPALLLYPAIRLSGDSADIFRTNLNRQISDALDTTQDVLLHSDTFDREAIASAGIDLSEEGVTSSLNRVSEEISRLTDGDLSPLDLLHTVLFAQKALPIAESLAASEAAEGLFDSLGIADSYAGYRSACSDYGRYASWGLIAYEALLGLIVLCALGSILFSLFGRSKVFDVLLLILECILFLPFAVGTLAGNRFLASIDMQGKLDLLPGYVPIAAIAAVLVVIILKATLPRKAKR